MPPNLKTLLLSFSLIVFNLGGSLAQTPSAPAWHYRTWKSSFSLPAGNYEGPTFGTVNIRDKSTITWEPGSVMSKVEFDVQSHSKIRISGCLFRDVRMGINLHGNLIAKECAFEQTAMFKAGGWYDPHNPSTSWKFEDCVFVKKFMANKTATVDFAISAKNCTFIDLKLPAVHYRNDDAGNQAQQEWMRFENCRFINCEVNENALLMAINCVFENCTYTGTSNYWGTKLKKPLSVTAYWSGRPEKSYQQDNLTVTFISTTPPFEAGAKLPYRYERGVLSMPGILGATSAVQAVGRIPDPEVPESEKKEVATNPTSPTINQAVTGSAGANMVPLKLQQTATNALLVINLPGQGEAGAAVKLSALTLPISSEASAEVIFNQEVGPLMQTALREVVKFIQIKHGGWPKGHRIELSFAEKYSAKDGPSAAVACALLLDSMLSGIPLDPEFAVTGDLNADGSVQPIGGIAGKIRGAMRGKCNKLGIPLKNAKSVYDVLVLDGPSPFARLEIYSFDKFDEIQKIARPAATPELIQASALFAEVQPVLFNKGQFNHAVLNAPGVQQRLAKIVELVPNHLSAQMLLAQGRGKAPKVLSLSGSLDAVDDAGQLLLRSIKSETQETMTGLSRDELAVSLNKLVNIRPKLDPRVIPTLDALHRFGVALRQWQNQPPQGRARVTQAWASLKAVAGEADRERAKLATDRDVLEELME